MLSRPLIEKNRRLARLVLYLLPVVFLGVTWSLTRVDGRMHRSMSWHGVDFTKYESVRLFQEFLRFDTSYPEGNEIPAAEYLARLLEAEGIGVTIDRVGHRNANLWAILEGDEKQALVLHNHIDVEPVLEPKRWRYPPFGGVIDNPFIYGRGAFDMKSVTIAQLMSVLKLKREGVALRRSLIFLATGDEERFSDLGARRLIQERPELIERFYAVLSEGGAIEAVDLEAVKYWGTEFGQKRFIDILVRDENQERMEALRDKLRAVKAPPRAPSGALARFLKLYSESRDSLRLKELLAKPETILEKADYEKLPPYLKAMTRNEIAVFPVKEDPEGGYVMRLVLHLLPGVDLETGKQELLSTALEGFAHTVRVPHEPTFPSPIDHPVFQTIHEYMADALPEADHGPLFLPWVATDSRFFRAAGVPSYGYSPFWILSSDANKMKGRNERMAAPAFVEGVERYQELIHRLVARL